MNGRLDNPQGLKRLADTMQAAIDRPPMTPEERIEALRILYGTPDKAQAELPLERKDEAA